MSLLKTKHFIFVGLGIIFILAYTLPIISKDGVVEERKGFDAIIETGLTKKAESGDGKAAYCLSMNYEYQRKADSKEKYMYWLHKAAEFGNADAQHDLGDDYGVKSREGVKLLRMAAEQGHSTAQTILGDLSCSESNKEQAEYWYRKSAMQGRLFSILHLTKLLNKTKTQEKNLIEGYAWSLVGLSRCHPRSGFAADFKKEQEAIIKEATELGYEKAAFIKQAEIEADKINKNIQVIWVTPSWEDCEEYGSK
jgi:TPR repeat protein